jgi:hypothetical protein
MRARHLLCWVSLKGLISITEQPLLKLKLSYDRRSVSQSVLMSGSHLKPITRFLFSVWQLRVSWCEVPSLTRGWVCNLLVQLLLGLGSQSRRIRDNILLCHLRLSKPGGRGPRIYIPQKKGSPVIPPGTGFPFRRTLRLAGQRWRCTNLPPHGKEQPLMGGWLVNFATDG